MVVFFVIIFFMTYYLFVASRILARVTGVGDEAVAGRSSLHHSSLVSGV